MEIQVRTGNDVRYGGGGARDAGGDSGNGDSSEREETNDRGPAGVQVDNGAGGKYSTGSGGMEEITD